MWWKWLYYLNQSIDAMQSLLTTNGIFHRTKTDNFTIFRGNTKDPKEPKQSWERNMELEESPFLTSDYITKLQSQDSVALVQKTEI